jgi:hypothetical protein
MLKRIIVVLVSVLLLQVGAAFAGTAGMYGSWDFVAAVDDGGVYPMGSIYPPDGSGYFDFDAGAIELTGTFFGSQYVIYGPFVDNGDGTYAANDLLFDWSVNIGVDFDDQLWEITDNGNDTASVVSLITPANIIAGTLYGTSTVPLPGGLGLLGSGLLGLAVLKRQKK